MARTKGNFGHDKADKKAVIALAQRIPNFNLKLAADPSLWSDKDVVLAAVACVADNLRWASDELKADREVVTVAIASNGYSAMCYCNESFRSDPALVLAAVKTDGRALQWCSRELANDRAIVHHAIKKTPSALEYAPPQLRNDRETVVKALQAGKAHKFEIYSHASDELRGDREILKLAIRYCGGSSLLDASGALQSDRELVLLAIEDCGSALEGASEELRADREIVLKAIQNGSSAFFHASQELRNDRSVVMAALESCSSDVHCNVLRFTSKQLQDDKDLILFAVKKEGFMIQYASPRLRGDREIVEAALRNKGNIRASAIVYYISKELQGDRRLISGAIEDDSQTLFHASKELQMDASLVALAFSTVAEKHDHALLNEFESSSLEKLYIEKLKDAYKEIKRRSKTSHFKVDDPNSMVQFAECWLGDSLQKKWLAGEMAQNVGIPGGLKNLVMLFSGVDQDIMAAQKLLRISTILCYVKKGFDDNYVLYYWNSFVTDANKGIGSDEN